MAIRYTKQQKASPFFEEYKKERARLQRFARRAKARGITLPYDFVPDVPKKITAGSVRKLQRITPEHGYYERAEYMRVNPESGEIVFKTGSQTAISRGISAVKARQEEGETWVSAREANRYLPPRRKEREPEPIDTTPQDVIDDTGNYWYEDTYEPDDSDYDYEEPDYSEYDTDFDEAFDSDYRSEIDRINWQVQLDRVNAYIDNSISYIGQNVSGHMADAIGEMVSQFRSAVSDEAWAELMDDENFWTDISSMVEEYYKSRKDPMPEVYNRISSRLSGRPMTMEENSRYDEYAEEDDSDSYDY